MNAIFVASLAAVLVVCLVWGARILPREEWQFLAALPVRRQGHVWQGVNLTFYGLFSANALVLAVGLCYLLLRAAGIEVLWAAVTLAGILAACLPAARLVARVVEKKAHTFTVGGASFVGIVVAPWVILLTNRLLSTSGGRIVPPLVVLAALAISLAVGEGMGRLACLSFGCCYGRPLADCPPLLRRLFRGWATVFVGATKKAAYAGGLHGQPLVPIQTLTAFVNAGIALVGLYLYCRGHYSLACIGVLAASQGWRIVSELLRVDYRGQGTISGYQWMGLAGVIYIALLLPWLGEIGVPPRVDIGLGLAALWQPAAILLLQGLWLVVFVFMGRSTVTRSAISLQVIEERT